MRAPRFQLKPRDLKNRPLARAANRRYPPGPVREARVCDGAGNGDIASGGSAEALLAWEED